MCEEHWISEIDGPLKITVIVIVASLRGITFYDYVNL